MKSSMILLLALLILPMAALADGRLLAEDLQAFEQARDLAGVRERISRASEAELGTAPGWRWRAWLAQVDGQAEQAVALAEQGLKDHPDDVDLVLLRASLRLLDFNDAGALRSMRIARALRNDFERAVELDPDHVMARVALIQYYLNAPRVAGGGAGRAKPHIDFLDSIDSPAHLDMQALIAMAEQRPADALDKLEQALAIEASADRRLQYALVLQQAERWDQAFAVLEQLVMEQPTFASAWYQLGRTAVLSESALDQGLLAFQRFLELPGWPGTPSEAAAWWRIGQIHALQSAPDLARQAFEQALLLEADFKPAREALDSLQVAGS